jgi:hypothetical protein
MHLFVDVCTKTQSNQCALRAVTAKDASLEFTNNQISGDVWYDDTRPGSLVCVCVCACVCVVCGVCGANPKTYTLNP